MGRSIVKSADSVEITASSLKDPRMNPKKSMAKPDFNRQVQTANVRKRKQKKKLCGLRIHLIFFHIENVD